MPPARCAVVKALKVTFTENRVLFSLEFLIATWLGSLGSLPRLRLLDVEVSSTANLLDVHQVRFSILAWHEVFYFVFLANVEWKNWHGSPNSRQA